MIRLAFAIGAGIVIGHIGKGVIEGFVISINRSIKQSS